MNFETSFKQHLLYLLRLLRDRASTIFNYSAPEQKIFSALFMLSMDGGKNFNWIMLEDQVEWIAQEVVKDISVPGYSRLMIKRFVDQTRTFNFHESGLVSYFKKLGSGTDVIRNFMEEEYLIKYGYRLDETHQSLEFNQTIRDNEEIIGILNVSREYPINDPIDAFAYLEGKWAFPDVPFYYFKIYPYGVYTSKGQNASKISEKVRLLAITPLFLTYDSRLEDNYKNIDRLYCFIDFARSATLGTISLREKIKEDSDKILEYSLRSAISAIMSRNGSHNIGSHVINRVVESIDSLNIQDHKYLFRYLQQRMDFVAQISTDFSQWSTPHWFVKEIMKGFYEQKHLLNYIASSEGLKGFDIDNGCRAGKTDVKCIIKNVDKYHCDKAKPHECFESVTNCTQCEMFDQSECKHRILICGENECTSDLSNDILVSVPGGLVGFHAFYTILENFIRNSAKHCYAGHPEHDSDMIVTIEIWNYEDDNEYYSVIIRDNYSFVSGNVDKNIDEPNRKKLSEQKIWVYTPEDTDITCIGEGNDIVFQQINEADEKAEKEIRESANNSVAFVVDDGKVFRDNSVFKRLCSCDNIRFIEGAYWNKLCLNDNNEQKEISKDKLYEFLSTYYTPTHFKINKAIMEPLINDDGSLKRSNWGIGEMKITAGYLKGCSIREIGGRGDTNLKNIIKAIAIPEKDPKTNQIKAYRLGYEFRMRKPVDVHIIGYDCDRDILKQAEKKSIFISSNYDTQARGEMIVLYDSQSDHEGSLIQLLKQLLNSSSDIDVVRERIKLKIEKYHKYRLFIVSQHAKIKNIIENDVFLKRRLVFLAQKEFENKFLSNSAHDKFNAFKTWLRTMWIIHIKEKIRGIDSDIDLIVEPESNRPDKSETKALDEKLFELAFRRTLKQLKIAITDNDIEECLVNATESDNFSAYLLTDWPITSSKKYQLPKYYSSALESALNLMEAIKDFLTKDFGISNKSYLPPTLPDELRGKELEGRKGKESDLPNLNGTIKVRRPEQEQNPQTTIRYVRHSKCRIQNKYLYCEDLTGSASHYPQLSHMPSEASQKVAFVCGLLENGLLRIGIADERVYETVVQNGRGYDELTAAGIVFFNKIGNVELKQSVDAKDSMEISMKGGKLKLNTENCCDIIVLHQGILDKLDSSLLAEVGGIDKFILSLKEKIPFIVVTSGRGKPSDLPAGVKFLPFSLLEASILSLPHSKLTLVKQIL